MKKLNNKQTKGKGGFIFLLIIIAIVCFINQFIKKEDSVEPITNQIDINMEHKIYKIKDDEIGKYIYYAGLKEQSIEIKKLLISEIKKKYCLKNGLEKFVQVYNFNPMIVKCRSYKNGELKILLVSDNWLFNLNDGNKRNGHNLVIGNSKKYLILSDMTLVNKKSGEIIVDNILTQNYDKNNRRIRFKNYSRAVISSNNTFYIHNKKVKHDSNLTSIIEINQNAKENEIVKLPQFQGIPSANVFIKAMKIIDDGNYLYLIVDYGRRGSGSGLVFYMVDVLSKTIVYKKIFEERKSIANVLIEKHLDNVSILYRVQNKFVKLYYFNQTKFKNKEVSK